MRLELVPIQAGIMDVTLENVPDLRKRFAEETAGSAMDIMGQTSAAPGPLYDRMTADVERVLAGGPQAANAPVLGRTLRRAEVKDAALARPVAASALEQADALVLSIGYMYGEAERQGGFLFRHDDSGPQVMLKTTRALLEQAVMKRDELEHSLEEDRRLARLHATHGLMLLIREKTEALQIESLLRPKFETLAKAIRVAHALTEGARRPFRDFFDDLVVLQSMAIVAADGYQRQFASRFTDQLHKGDTYEACKLPILNAVARHAYLSAGITEPQIQRIFKHSVDSEAHSRVRHTLDERRVGRLLDKRPLRKRDELFWMQRQGLTLPTKGGANVACEVLTELVRADGDALLTALDAQTLFQEVASVGLSADKGRDPDAGTREAARVEVRGLLATALCRDSFAKFLSGRMQVWLPVVHQRLAEAAVAETEDKQTMGEEPQDTGGSSPPTGVDPA